MMDLNKERTYICKLIFREIIGDLSEEEKLILDNWSDLSPQNKKLRTHFNRLDAVLERIDKYDEIKIEDYLPEFEAMMASDNKRYFRRRTRVILWGGVAALFAGICMIVKILFSPPVDNDTVIQDDILSGSSNAILVLENNQSIQLSGDIASNTTEITQKGIRLSDSTIDYSTATTGKSTTATHKILVPHGGTYNVTLSDGSRIYLNSESSMEYPVIFDSKTRVITLTGEAFFEVKKDPNRSFVVRTPKMEVYVTGTTFNLRAYEDENYVATTLVTGSIEVINEKQEKVLLQPSQHAVMDIRTNEISVETVNVQLYTAHRYGQFVFRDVRLEDIMNDLKRWYSIEEIIYADEKVKNMHFSARLNREQSVTSFLSMLEATKKIKIRIENRKITFMAR